MGLYVYGICRAGGAELPPLVGVLDQPVYRTEAAALCAIVSDCSLETVRAERKHIVASQRVASALADEGFDLLPMTFGTVTASQEELARFLDEQGEALAAQLQRIAGAVEMSLKLTFDIADPVAFLVERTPELQAARARTFGGRRPPSYDERIRLGQMVDAALGRFRDASAARILAAVGRVCTEVLPLPIRDEKEAANLAFLVPRADLGRFDEAVNTAASELDDALVVAIGGPWPPHNFIAFDGRTP